MKQPEKKLEVTIKILIVFVLLLGGASLYGWLYIAYILLNPAPAVTVERTKNISCITVKNKSNQNESSTYCGEVVDI